MLCPILGDEDSTAATFKRIQKRDEFELVLDHLRWIYRYRELSSRTYKIYVTMIYTDETAHEVEDLLPLFQRESLSWPPCELNYTKCLQGSYIPTTFKLDQSIGVGQNAS